MTRVALALCVAALACVSHDDATHAADATAHGAAACPGPVIESGDWREVALEGIPVTLRLPPGYVEKRYDVRVGDPKGQTFRGGDFQSLYVDEQSGPADLDSAGFRLRAGITDYSDCREEVGGRVALVQASRGSGVIFYGERQWPELRRAADVAARSRALRDGGRHERDTGRTGHDARHRADAAASHA
jgi:hypothetical protein